MAASAAPASLAAAVEAGSSFHAERHLRAGGGANQVLQGEPLLVHAARAGNFELCRVLLLHGASPDVRTRSGQPIVEIVPSGEKQSLALRFLLRTAVFLKEHARPAATGAPARPGLVIVFEPTVDYTHPAIAPHYHVNTAELNGRAGVDDDGDGFIDNVYGWATVSDRPHMINLVQAKMWSDYRTRIHELVDLHNRETRGELEWDSPSILKLRTTFQNPISALFGASGGYSDSDFLKAIIDVSHGSHVAGTVIEWSGEKASLHTLSWDNFGHLQPHEMDYPKVTSGDPDVWLAEFRSRTLPEMIARGRRGSDYLRATQCGVVNGSFGLMLRAFVARANSLAQEMARLNPGLRQSAVFEIAYEMYAYHTIPFVVAVAENPQIFFVAAAGNDSEDIDLTLGSPAYLSRFFPNVITVAAAEPAGAITSFSNYGRSSVNIAAPGRNIESFGVAGTRLLMNGTSMAAPAVSGFAARLRLDRPDITAAEIRRIIELSAQGSGETWNGKISSAGLLNPDGARALAAGRPEAIEEMAWRLTEMKPDDSPEAWAAGLEKLQSQTGTSGAGMWHARAAALDTAGLHREALPAIDRSLALSEGSLAAWRSKCLILSNLKEHSLVVAAAKEVEKQADARRLGAGGSERLDILTLGIRAAEALGARADIDFLSRRHEAVFASELGPRLSAERRETGRLAAGNRTLDDNRFFQQFTFAAQTGDRVSVDLLSRDFDTYLILRSPSGKEWSNDDYDESTSRSRIVQTVPESGRYTVIVTSYSGGETGAFELVMSPAPRQETGRLAQGSRTLPGGEYFNDYALSGQEGARVQIDLRSEEFDTYLMLRSPAGVKWDNDDHEDSTSHSRIALTLPVTGEYRVLVTSYAAGQTGGYTLEISGGKLAVSGTDTAFRHRRPGNP